MKKNGQSSGPAVALWGCIKNRVGNWPDGLDFWAALGQINLSRFGG
ncbi:hypothetical protein DWUX_1511 [Desulfovibrio diazotrophicus]|nr:hypothetical protein DWUX_1511 [Desulfovibrio diazotrophicus]